MTSTMARTDRALSVTELPEVAEPGQVAPQDARELSKQFFRRLTELEEGTHEYQYARNTLIEMNMSLVRYAAGRFRSRGPEEMEDIVQVGMIGLIKAIDRFELSREVEFTSFAIPYIVGEIKRFFRDTSWSVRVPRRLQELRLAISEANTVLSHSLGRSPTVADVAAHLNITEEEVLEGLEGARAYNSVSLSTPMSSDSGSELGDMLGEADPEFAQAELKVALEPALATLDPREQKIVILRFYGNLTQSQIAEQIGVSQMHVSRLLSKALVKLRGQLADLG